MSSNKTTNYQLHSWEPGDDFIRSEFNENFSALDTAIKGVETGAAGALDRKVVSGSYTGDGSTSKTINLGFTPKAMILTERSGITYSGGDTWGGLLSTALPLKSYSGTFTAAEIIQGGFTVHYNSGKASTTNTNGWVYVYLAVR